MCAFSELQSHSLSTERFGRPAKGNPGKEENLVGDTPHRAELGFQWAQPCPLRRTPSQSTEQIIHAVRAAPALRFAGQTSPAERTK